MRAHKLVSRLLSQLSEFGRACIHLIWPEWIHIKYVLSNMLHYNSQNIHLKLSISLFYYYDNYDCLIHDNKIMALIVSHFSLPFSLSIYCPL